MSVITPPQALPVFADDPYTDENLANPYPMFERMRAAGPAVWLEKYGVPAFAGFEECRDILEDYRTFISGAGVGPKNLHKEPAWRPQGILESDPPVHGPMRAAMAGVISPRGVRSLRAGFEVFAKELVDRLLDQQSFDGVTELAELFPIRVFGDAVGIPREGREKNLLPHGAMNFSAFGPDDDRSRSFFEKGAGTHEWVMANCARENLSPDGMGAQIWAAADRGEITADQAALLVRAMLSAGLDTTVFSIGNTLQALAAHPEQWDALHAKPRLAKFAIDEALRFESPFQSFFRTVSEDTVFHGIPLAAGSKVLLFVGSANRDTRQWGDTADEFRIDRNAGGHLAFGMGIHQCVGQPISRLEMDVLFTEMATRIKSIELCGEPVPYLHNTLRGWSSIPLKVTAA
ncbi:cytochrome [Arthrobacter sp. SW1]|uniref:cytochrome P450 n=1 Tax=Arthrobacter sp. SW1 TaxID=1920889 RepID=UPI000877BEE5|nr:cytochrome P450 [Arthrobacter sp. SW1]OFI38516.1 cytochrome [Arthrobacter sp. SW1]